MMVLGASLTAVGFKTCGSLLLLLRRRCDVDARGQWGVPWSPAVLPLSSSHYGDSLLTAPQLSILWQPRLLSSCTCLMAVRTALFSAFKDEHCLLAGIVH